MKYSKLLKKSLIISGSTIVVFSSALSLYENLTKKINLKLLLGNQRDKITNLISNNSKEEDSSKLKKLIKPKEFWANEIKKGGFILFMRHAKRDKWKDVSMYDAAEVKLFKKNKLAESYGENTYYANGVCLNKKGIAQAKMIKEKIIESGIPIGYVISSPSCRARQTAILSFGRHDKIDNMFMHTNAFNEVFSDYQSDLKKVFLNIPIFEGKNTVITSHGNVVDKSLFKNPKDIKGLNQGGFYIISKSNDELKLEYSFSKFDDFAKVFSYR